MPEQTDVELADFGRIGDLRFRKRATNLYDAAIRDNKDLLEQYSREGIASTGKFVRKVADAVVAQFKTIEQVFEETYIGQFENTPLSKTTEQWLREKAQKIVESEVVRAQGVAKHLCSSFVGAAPDAYRAYVVHLQDEGRTMQQRLNDAITLLMLTTNARTDTASATTANPVDKNAARMPEPTVLVFISHSSKDADLALALIELLKAGLGLLSKQIRCSSVDGYRLPVGANTETQLREEVRAAKVMIGLITPSSMSSSFVLFELGARWGAGLFLAPLLAGVKAQELSRPLNLLNALSSNNDAQLHQLLDDVSKQLGLPLQNAASYVRNISAVRQLSEGISTAAGEPTAVARAARDFRMSYESPQPAVTRGPKLDIRFFPNVEPYHFIESPHNEAHYRMGIYNDGPGTAENLQAWLLRITPRPSSPLFRADFPYAARWAQGYFKDDISYRLNPKSEVHFELLVFWISHAGEMILDGIDTKQESRDSRFPIEDKESWRMEYEVSCANADLQRPVFLVRREGQKLFVSREVPLSVLSIGEFR